MKLVYINPDCYADVDLNLLKYLAREFEVAWYPVYYTDRPIYVSPEEMTAYASENGIQLHLCPRKFRQRDPRNLGFYADIVQDINAWNPDIVYTCITEELWWVVASRKLTSPKRVLGIHDVLKHSDNRPLKRFIQGQIQDLAIKCNTNYCVFSESQRQLFHRLYGKSPVVFGLGSKDFGPSDLHPAPVSQEVSLLFFGNIVRYKGLDLLIESLEQLRQEGIRNIRLTIAGKGDDWPNCEKLLRTPEMFDLRVRFIENVEIPDLFCSHHFLALPYRDATQSGPVSIAANYGLPIFAPEYGCFIEQYDRAASVLYSDLEAGLRRLSSMTDEEYYNIKLNAEKEKIRVSAQVIADKYIEFFKSLC